jgi:hypothetical protein
MGAEKFLSIFAAIITIISTFILSWAAIDDAGTIYYAYGIAIIKNIPNMYINANALEITLGVPSLAIYIIASLLIWFLTSGLTQLFGIKSRWSAITGAIMPLIIGGLIIYYSFTTFPIPWIVNVFGDSVSIVEGVIPFNYAFGVRPESIGTYGLLIGGLFSLFSGFISRED